MMGTGVFDNNGLEWLQTLVIWYNRFLMYYLGVMLVLALGLVIVGWLAVNHYVRMRPLRDYRHVGTSELSMPVSIIVPGFNEALNIAESVRSLLATQFSQLEVIVVNDGSTDETLQVLKDAFKLVAIERTPRSGLPTAKVRQVYASPLDSRIVVIDKENGGKADALNAGINFSQYPLVSAIDADTMLDPGALARLVWEFQSHTDTVATGGIVRIANGSTVKDGRLVSIATPHRQFMANVQIVEYLRAFLGGRLGWSRLGMLMIISGAFGLFRRDVLVNAGGYSGETITEDAELVLRIRKYQADHDQPCRITFFPDPICWTEAPTTMKALVRQRDRWQRGLGETLIRHRGMLFRKKYGRIGWVALPYFWLFEFLEPLITVTGMIITPLAILFGFGSIPVYLLMLTFAFAYGYFISMVIILLEERAFRRYPNWVDLRRMTVVAFFENFGFRQWQALVRMRAIFRIRSSRKQWGEQKRVGFTQAKRAEELPA